jgi:redox-sensitive bicupin YhaK (pirin superfamily)
MRWLESQIARDFVSEAPFQYFPAETFPVIHPVHWLNSHFAVGGWSPLQRLSGMLTAHMTQIAPHNGFTWHPHRALEIYTWMLEGELTHEDTTGGRGVIRKGELQRMFAGDYIEHQELNEADVPARVIQIWYVADRQYQGLPPHYQQLSADQLPTHHSGDATIYHLIGDGSPMEQHVQGRLSAADLLMGGVTTVELPRMNEQLFLYVTDGAGTLEYEGQTYPLGQYDVVLMRADAARALIRAETRLEWLNFYLPPFM